MSKKASELLKQVAEMSDQELATFFTALSEGSWDEWDCGLDVLFTQFGPSEIRLAARTGAQVALGMEIEQ